MNIPGTGTPTGSGHLLATLVCAILVCTPASEDTDTGAAQREMATAFEDSRPLATLIEDLSEIRGRFEDPSAMAWDFEGDKSGFLAIWSFGEEAVRPLAACIDRDSPTNVTVDGEPVLHGALCAAVLEGMVYHEEVDAYGYLTSWDGWVDMNATAVELAVAKQAWLEVIERGEYIRRDIGDNSRWIPWIKGLSAAHEDVIPKFELFSLNADTIVDLFWHYQTDDAVGGAVFLAVGDTFSTAYEIDPEACRLPEFNNLVGDYSSKDEIVEYQRYAFRGLACGELASWSCVAGYPTDWISVLVNQDGRYTEAQQGAAPFYDSLSTEYGRARTELGGRISELREATTPEGVGEWSECGEAMIELSLALEEMEQRAKALAELR